MGSSAKLLDSGPGKDSGEINFSKDSGEINFSSKTASGDKTGDTSLPSTLRLQLQESTTTKGTYGVPSSNISL
eukprot:gene13431-16497_t